MERADDHFSAQSFSKVCGRSFQCATLKKKVNGYFSAKSGDRFSIGVFWSETLFSHETRLLYLERCCCFKSLSCGRRTRIICSSNKRLHFGCRVCELSLNSTKCIGCICFYCSTYVWRMRIMFLMFLLHTAKLCSQFLACSDCQRPPDFHLGQGSGTIILVRSK